MKSFIIGAFDGWKCLLLVDQRKQKGFTRVLEAGGAELYSLEDAKTTKIDHVFTEENKIKKTVKETLKKMQEKGVQVMRMNYITSFLTERNIDPVNYQIELK